MTVETEVAALTTATTALLSAVNVQKATLDTSVTAAQAAQTASAANAATANTKAIESGASASASATSAAQSVAAKDLAIAAWSSANAPAESLAAISQSVHYGAVVASFLYDTSKDSDAGQWRKRCADKSWYTEAIQTGVWRGQRASLAATWAISGAAVGDWYQSTADGLFYVIGGTSGTPTQTQIYRGSAREFPALALIVAEAGRAVIYDASAPGCPMWMVFKANIGYLRGATVTSAYAVQGLLIFGSPDSGIEYANFLTDDGGFRNNSAGCTYQGNIASRNAAQTYAATGPAIVNATVNAVAATVLADAPIDQLTGLAVPTIYAFTAGGVSRIAHDGTVTSTPSTAVSVGWIDGRYVRALGQSGLVSASILASSALPSGGGAGLDNYWGVESYFTTTIPAILAPNSKGIKNIYGGNSGVSVIKGNPAAKAKGMVADITKDYQTGWKVGDIKRCWLADTVAETVTAPELVTNGDGTDAAGWSLVGDGSFIASGGVFTMTNGATAYAYAHRTIATIVGKTYKISAKQTGSTTSGSPTLRASTSAGAGDLVVVVAAPSATDYSASFVATTTTTFVRLLNSAVTPSAGQYSTWDDISVKLAEPDRSVKNKPITVVGSLTKSPVAAGAGLVAYSGFSASNYLEEAYSSDLDFGTGDFCVMGWVNLTSVATIQGLFCRTMAASSGGIEFRVNATGYLEVYLTGTVSYTLVLTSTSALTANTPTLIEVDRSSGTLTIRFNGTVVGTVANTTNLTLANAVTRLGLIVTGAYPVQGSMALWRIGSTAPSADQIAYIYKTEKALFQPGAQCTLAGSSNAVTALAYDDETDTWHAGTSYGRTGFRDLLRVDSEVTTVGAITSISAANGAVLLGGASSAKYYQPAFLLRDEIRRKAEARRALGKESVFFDVDAVASQTAFTVQQGYTVKAVYSAGTLKRLGSTKDYTVSFDGFRETVNFAVSPGAAAWVSIMAVRA